jgi:CPA1 family monovalent cation:H+ antiporter
MRLPVGFPRPAVMTDTIQTVFVVTALLGLVSLLLPLAERLSIPYAVLLAVVGIAIGGMANLPFASHPGNIVSDVVSWLHDFGLSAESLLYVFLPALRFEAALSVDVRQLSDEVGPVLLLAGAGFAIGRRSPFTGEFLSRRGRDILGDQRTARIGDGYLG